MRQAALVVVFLLFSAAPVFSFTGEVVGVLDGDTIEVMHNGKAERIRLNGIDCPEKRQPFGKKAKQFTSALVFGKVVTVEPLRKDRHGRTVGDVTLSDGTNVSRELVKAGLAWWYRKYSTDQSLEAWEHEAHDAKRGLWSHPNSIPPWEIRHPSTKLDAPPISSLLSGDSSGMTGTAMPIMGNQKSHVYHRPDCPNYGQVAKHNQIAFNSAGEAEAAGYRMAANCP